MNLMDMGGQRFHHIGIIVADIVEASARWGQRFGFDVPEHFMSAEQSLSETAFMGSPTDARVKQVLFDIPGGAIVELLEPVGGASEWRRALESNGEGPHHFGWLVDDFDRAVAGHRAQGARLVQHGRFQLEDGAMGEYAYLQHREQDITFEVIGGMS